MLGILLNLLMLPVTGPPKLVRWLATTVEEEYERQTMDEGPIRGALLELQQRYDAGALTDAEYDDQEAVLMSRLRAARELKARRAARQ